MRWLSGHPGPPPPATPLLVAVAFTSEVEEVCGNDAASREDMLVLKCRASRETREYLPQMKSKYQGNARRFDEKFE